MTDVMRHRRESAKQRWSAVDSGSVIEIGDLLWLDTNDAKPAEDKGWYNSLAQTQALFREKFIGCAGDRSRDGDTGDIEIDTSGISEFLCASTTWELGDLVGPAKQAAVNKLENQTVVAVANEELAIGRVSKRYPVATTRVEVELFSGACGLPRNPGVQGASFVKAGAHTVSAAEAAAAQIEIDTEFPGAAIGVIFQIRRSAVDVSEDAALYLGVTSTFKINHGAATYVVTAGDVVYYTAWK